MKSIFGYQRGFFKRFLRSEENSNNLKNGLIYIITGISIFGILSLIVFSNVFAQESTDEGEIRLWVQNYDFNTSMQVDLYNFKFERIDSITSSLLFTPRFYENNIPTEAIQTLKTNLFH